MATELGLGTGSVDWFDPHRRSVYVTPAPNHPGAVSVSPLVREYLLENHPLEPDQGRKLLLEASLLYEREGAMSEAMETAIRFGPQDQIADFVTNKGARMLTAGLARPIVEAIERIPRHLRDREILLLEAEARQVLGDWEGATECYEALTPGKGAIPARVAWRLGFLSHMRGDVTTALETYKRGERGEGDPAGEAALVGWTASAHWLKGERDEAKQLANEALELARKADDSGALATAHTVLAMVAAIDGDRAGAGRAPDDPDPIEPELSLPGTG
jgi:ATP/maltotriose-dependent transcriptional regulator MalT